jgi:CheY-like chemotaxis protein
MHIVSIDEIVKLIDAVTKLLGVLVWPALFAYILIRFGPALKEFFASLGEFTFKGGGFEATAKRKQAEAAAALVAASMVRADATTTPESVAREAKEAVNVVAETVNAHVIRRAGEATVLWVDDRPNNNIFERQALKALGVTFVLAASTDEALNCGLRQKFDAIISDMDRPPDHRAGYTLLEALQARNDRTPFFIYASSNTPEHIAEARARGASGYTNRASELFTYVLNAINYGATTHVKL